MLLLQLFDLLADGAAFAVGTADKVAADVPISIIFFYHDGSGAILGAAETGNIPFHFYVSFRQNCKHYYTEKEDECKVELTCKDLVKMI